MLLACTAMAAFFEVREYLDVFSHFCQKRKVLNVAKKRFSTVP